MQTIIRSSASGRPFSIFSFCCLISVAEDEAGQHVADEGRDDGGNPRHRREHPHERAGREQDRQRQLADGVEDRGAEAVDAGGRQPPAQPGHLLRRLGQLAGDLLKARVELLGQPDFVRPSERHRRVRRRWPSRAGGAAPAPRGRAGSTRPGRSAGRRPRRGRRRRASQSGVMASSSVRNVDELADDERARSPAAPARR